MRLDKFICGGSGVSRTQAKQLIRNGKVLVNTLVVRDPSHKVDLADSIVCENRVLSLSGPRYLMLNKPEGAVCTSIDDDARSVLALLDVQNVNELHMAGRLDIDTTGLVLLTDDGTWSHNITSPRKLSGKRYLVTLADPVAENAVAQFSSGIQLKGELHLTRPAQLEILSSHEVRLTLHEGKYHQVKRMFAALGNRVVALHREQIGEIKLDASLAPGEWRWLSETEITSV